jgi:hypothetical protein
MSNLMLMGVGGSAPIVAPAATERAVVGFGSGFSTTTDSSSFYIPFGGVGFSTNTTQANGAFKWRGAGTFRNLYVTISANTRGTDTVLFVQKNGVDTALTVTITGGVTTTKVDTSNSFDVADGDLIGVRIGTSTGGGTITIRSVTAQFETAGQIFTHMSFYGGATANAANTYYAPAGSGVSTTTEANAEVMKALEAYTSSYMHALISANAASTTCTFTSQDNNADGNQTFNVLATVTGLGEDSNGAHTDAIAADQTFTVKKGSTTGNVTVVGAGCRAAWSTAGRVQVNAVQSTTVAGGATFYGGMFGPAMVSSTETQASQKMPFAARFSKLCCFVTSNASSVGATLTLRIAGSDTSVTVTIAAGATGFMTASGNTADCAVADLISTKLTGQDGNIVINWVGMLVTDITP